MSYRYHNRGRDNDDNDDDDEYWRQGSSSSSSRALSYHRPIRGAEEQHSEAALAMGLAAVGIAAGVSLLMSDKGNTKKASTSYMKYTNDFELVIRATKDLEQMLVDHFDAPQATLSAKIEHVYRTFSLPYSIYMEMKDVVEIRNKLVHQYGYNELGQLGREQFAKKVDTIVDALLGGSTGRSTHSRTGETESECVVM